MRIHVTCPHCRHEQYVICAIIDSDQVFWCGECFKRCIVAISIMFIVTSGEPDAGHLGIKTEAKPEATRGIHNPIRNGPAEGAVYTTVTKAENQ